MLIASEPVAINMAASTLYLHELLHRRNQTQRVNTGPATMPGIREAPDEDENVAETAAAAALFAAIDNLSCNPRIPKSNQQQHMEHAFK